MPRPPILAIPPWEEIFRAANTFESWLERGEKPDHQAVMRDDARNLPVPKVHADRLRACKRRVNVLVFAEDWCPDVVRHVPVLEALKREYPVIQSRYLLRADRPEIYERYLTFGGEGVPVFVFLSENWAECGFWGPMPEDCKRWIARGRASGEQYAARIRVFHLYLQDPDRTQVFEDFTRWIAAASSETIETDGLIVKPK